MQREYTKTGKANGSKDAKAGDALLALRILEKFSLMAAITFDARHHRRHQIMAPLQLNSDSAPRLAKHVALIHEPVECPHTPRKDS